MRLFVSNINYDAVEQDLRDLFIEAGVLPEKLNIVTNDDGTSRGFGFVDVLDREEGERAIEELHGERLIGRRIRVVEAKPRRDKRLERAAGAPRGERDMAGAGRR